MCSECDMVLVLVSSIWKLNLIKCECEEAVYNVNDKSLVFWYHFLPKGFVWEIYTNKEFGGYGSSLGFAFTN